MKLKDVLYSHFEEMSRELGPEMSIENHKKIFEAIKNRDAQRSRLLMKQNIQLIITTLEERA